MNLDYIVYYIIMVLQLVLFLVIHVIFYNHEQAYEFYCFIDFILILGVFLYVINDQILDNLFGI
jgi:hypothetical protein